MILVLVNDKGNVVGKETYGGDDNESTAIIDKLKRSNPTLTYAVVDKDTFEKTSVATVVSKEQTDWQTERAKGTMAALDYIAKKLGLQ